MLDTHMPCESIYKHENIPRSRGIFLHIGGFMSKKDHKRTPNKKIYQYENKASFGNAEYFGIHKNGDRIKIDSRRMKKIASKEGLSELYEAALKIAAIPRNTSYFTPKTKKKLDYVVNEFRLKISTLREQWHEFRTAFASIKTPKQVADHYRNEALSYTVCSDDYDEICSDAILVGLKREMPYYSLEASMCAQFIHQMATELDAIMLRKCRYLGYTTSKDEQIKRDHLHAFLQGYVHGQGKMEDLPNYKSVYRKFFMIWNFLKHNNENLFEKVRSHYSDMLLTDTYRNGEMSMYCLKIGNDYIENMLTDLNAFYESVCEVFFGEDKEESKWNYDAYFLDIVREINEVR